MSRRLRRFHRTRLKKKHLSYEMHQHGTLATRKSLVARTVDYVSNCSCSACGNQRHNRWLPKEEQLTLPERKANQRYQDMLMDIDEYKYLYDK